MADSLSVPIASTNLPQVTLAGFSLRVKLCVCTLKLLVMSGRFSMKRQLLGLVLDHHSGQKRAPSVSGVCVRARAPHLADCASGLRGAVSRVLHSSSTPARLAKQCSASDILCRNERAAKRCEEWIRPLVN